MKKYILYILLFVAIIFVIDVSVGYAGGYLLHNAKPSQNQQFDDLCLKDKHDVIIMGSSRAHHHYVPQVIEDSLALDVYNAGTDGNGVILSYGVLQMILERYKPKCIIYDVEPAFDINIYGPDNNRTRYLSLLKPYFNHKCVAEIMKDVSKETYIKSYSGLCRYNSTLLNFMKEYFIGGEYYEKGYAPLYGEMSTPTHSQPIQEPIIDSVKVKYLKMFVECCKENDIQIVLALSPKYGVDDEKTPNFVRDVAKQYGVLLIDEYKNHYFLKNIGLFEDRMHLNDRGANDYSKMVCSALRYAI